MRKKFYLLYLLLIIMIISSVRIFSDDSDILKGKFEYVSDNIILKEEVDDSYLAINEEVVEEEEQGEKNEVLVGSMSGYGPDCVGCSGYLAYKGIYVGDGSIYYNDLEYGMVRIVAGDRSIEFGTIVKVNDYFLAIVLDRGGAIGFGKKFLFDLLYPSEYIANENGILVDTTFEILRRGF